MLACLWKKTEKAGNNVSITQHTSVGIETLVLFIIIVWRVVLIEALMCIDKNELELESDSTSNTDLAC
jgi:hypothetical protein